MGTLHFEGLSREGGGQGSVFEDIKSRFLLIDLLGDLLDYYVFTFSI